MKVLRAVIGVSVGLWVLVGLAYPLAMTGISQVIFPYQANGSQVKLNGKVVASAHVGQYFDQSQYFWGRPSATSPPYNPEASSPSNLGPTNKLLIQHIKARVALLLKTTPGLKVNQIPASMVESSGSGLDPDITVQSALIQIPRIAKATGIQSATLRRIVTQHIVRPQLGIFGRSHVNVVDLNLAVFKLLHP